MRRCSGSLALLLVLAASSADAFERIPFRDTAQGPTWSGTSTCTLLYYNRCTGWSWAWSGWNAFERIGVSAVACCPNAVLTHTALRVPGSTPGYGYGNTGVVFVYATDANDCPVGLPLAAQAWLPGTFAPRCYPTAGFDIHDWNLAVPSNFAVMYEFGVEGGGGFSGGCGATLATDHPAAAGTDPPACGLCYPTTRSNHTYYWGTPFDVICPGSTFFDGVCDAQLALDIVLSCPTAVAPQRWSRVKALYR
jgi:hypothetical protein